MKKIVKKINRNTLEGEFIYLNFFCIQNLDNLGSFTDTPFISTKIDRVLDFKDKFTRVDNTTLSSWYDSQHTIVSGTTSSSLVELKSYNVITPYIVDFDIEAVNYINYNNQPISGRSRVTNIIENRVTYVFDANNDLNIGTEQQTTGIRYIDTSEDTFFFFENEGFNATNSSLEAIYKDDYLIGITDTLETKSDVFIDRGAISVSEMILRMSEINNLNQLEKYGNGFFNLVK